MLLTTLAVAALTSPSALASAPVSAPPLVREDHGKLPWFEGSFEDLLAKAKAEKKIVFLDFWADW